MAKGRIYPFLTARIPGEFFEVGVDEVTGFKVGPGMLGMTLLIVQYKKETERRFMVHPANLSFEVAEPVEVEIPEEAPKPTLLVPK